MSLPKPLAAAVCTAVLGAQLWVSYPISREMNGWYWPFLAYPMYSMSHTLQDSLLLPELRGATCSDSSHLTTFQAESLGTPRKQLFQLLAATGRHDDHEAAGKAQQKLSRVVNAHFPGRFCSMSTWLRVVYVNDTSTHHLDGSARHIVTWPIAQAGRE